MKITKDQVIATCRLPRFYRNPETGQLEQVMPQEGAGEPNPDWRSPVEGEWIGRRSRGLDEPVEDCYWRNGKESWEVR